MKRKGGRNQKSMKKRGLCINDAQNRNSGEDAPEGGRLRLTGKKMTFFHIILSDKNVFGSLTVFTSFF